MEDRKEKYDALSEEYDIMQEIIDGRSSFTDILGQIQEGLEEGVLGSLRAFTGWYQLVTEVQGTPLTNGELSDMVNYYLTFSENTKNMAYKVQAGMGGVSAVIAGIGTYLKRLPERRQIGTALQIGGLGGLGATVLSHVQYRIGEKRGKPDVDEAMGQLYDIATELDNEVEQFYRTMNILPVIDEEGTEYGLGALDDPLEEEPCDCGDSCAGDGSCHEEPADDPLDDWLKDEDIFDEPVDESEDGDLF